MMKAGVGSCEVKLSLPIKKLTHQRDPLYVKVLQTDHFVLVSFDATSMPGETAEYFKEVVERECGMAKENVLISMTHSFSSPHFNSDENNAAFEQALCTALHQVEKKECQIGFSENVCDVNVQRNIETKDGWWIGANPDGFSNKKVMSLFLFHEEKPFACLVNYDIQSSCVMHEDPAAVSADLPGALADEYRREGITCFFLPGACADQAPIHDNYKELAKIMKKAISLPNPAEFVSEELKVTSVYLEKQKMLIPTKELTPHTSFVFESAGEMAEIPLIFLRLNEVMVCMTSPELNSAYGLLMENILPEKCMVVTMTNGAHKYLPQEGDYEKITYEAMNTVLARGSDRRFLHALEEELQK